MLHVVDAIGSDLAKLFVHKIMDVYLHRVALGAVAFPTVFEGPNEFLFLGIHGDDRLSILLKALRAGGDKLKLGIPVRMRSSLKGRITSYNVCYTKLLRHAAPGLLQHLGALLLLQPPGHPSRQGSAAPAASASRSASSMPCCVA